MMIFVCIISTLLLIYCLVIKLGHHIVSFNRYLALLAMILWLMSIIDLLGIFQLPLWIKWGLCLGIGHAIFYIVKLMLYAKNRRELLFEPDVIFVFGAGLIQNRISLSLKKRLNRACELAMQYQNAMIIVSGGQGKNEWLSEAEAMKNYLVENNIDSNRIFMEDKSTTTQENLVYSMNLYDLKDKKIALISNQFHVYRTEKMARKLGLNGRGTTAYMVNIGTFAFYIREYFACIKAFIKLEI